MKRNKEIKIRLTEKELLSLNQKTKKTSLSREAYCRKILGGGTGIAVGHTEPPTLVIYKTVKGDTALRTEVEPR